MTQFGFLERSDRQNFKNLKIQHGGGCHLEKLKKSPYLGNGSADFDQIWHDDTIRPS